MAEPKDLQQYIDVLLDVYRPAAPQEEATHFFSTDEIFDAIKSLNPGVEMSKNELYDAMLNAGFIFKPRRGTSGIDFRWLLVQK
jgi:hypothetical protein